MMDSQACTDQSKECGNPSQDCLEKIDKLGNVETSKNPGSESPTLANVVLPLGPITPDSNKEIGDVPFDLKSSPLTVLNKPRKICFVTDSSDNSDLFASTDCGSPRTPKDSVFDPFAPGPDDVMLAPHCKKSISQPKISVSRRLFFDSSVEVVEDGNHHNDAKSLSDDEMFESVYENLLELIVSSQTEAALAELSKVEWDSDGCKTPPSAPCINGVAETCPGAPMKPAAKSKNIDLGLCRKLEF